MAKMDIAKNKKKGLSILEAPGALLMPNKATTMSPGRGTFFGDRRVSMAESARRTSWLEKTRRGSLAVKNRGHILHEVRYADTFNGLYTCRFSPSGDSMATGFGAGAIQVRNPDNGEVKSTLRSGVDQGYPVMCIRYHPMRTDVFYAAGADGAIYMCNATNSEYSKYVQEVNNEVNAVDINLSGEQMATGGKDASVRIYDMENAQVIINYTKPTITLDSAPGEGQKYHRMRIFAVRYHHTMKETLVTGGWDDAVKIWDIRVKDGCVRNIRGPHICGDAIDMKERVILTGSWVVAGSLQLWDLGSAKLIETIKPANRPTTLDGEFLYTVQYFDGDPYGEMVCVGGSGTGAVEIISLKEKRVLGNFRVNKATQAIDSHGNILVFGGMETMLRIGEFS